LFLGGSSILAAQSDDNTVDEVDMATTWQGLVSAPRSQLVDVRTRAEWTYVGIPDLGPLGKRTVLVEWQTFPDQSVDPRFAERLANELKALGVQFDDDLFFICRSGSRSLAAAKAMAAVGYRACHNVSEGFEGPLDDERHRGALKGWKAAGLPWQQG
jgi:rhodanese-related sulfurtransferase